MKHLDKQQDRLERRQRGYQADKKGSTKLPGSMNSHKTMPKGIRRTRSVVKADSRSATC